MAKTAKPKLTGKEVRILELAMDVCEKLKDGDTDLAYQAETAFGHLNRRSLT